MELRNKKTGEIVDAWSFYDGNESVNLKYFTDDGQVNLEYRSLAELNEEWEDYKPVEPLIKDPKIRKAVRAWAEANGDTRVYYHRSTNEMCVNDDKGYVIRSIKFKFEFRASIGLESGWYTLAELCGEEEE